MLQVCTLLSGLVVHSMVLASMGSAGSQAAGVGSAYQTLLRKRLSSAELGDCRSGIVALRCLVSRLAREEVQARAPIPAHTTRCCLEHPDCRQWSSRSSVTPPHGMWMCAEGGISPSRHLPRKHSFLRVERYCVRRQTGIPCFSSGVFRRLWGISGTPGRPAGRPIASSCRCSQACYATSLGPCYKR